ncbi:hypothetical protein IU466_19685 [Nocardia farcinica]|nr:hypothetical protein [Nocardia farcinica]
MRKRLMIVGAAGLIALATGCSDIRSAPPAFTISTTPIPAMTQGQLCDRVLGFFRGELGAVDVSASSLRWPEADVSAGGVCTVLLGEGQSAAWEARRAPNDPDPTEGFENFVGTTKFGHPVWIRMNPADPVLDARFATRVGDWNGQIRVPQSGVVTVNGSLILDDATVRKVVEFLIELTRELSTLPE